MNEQAAIKRPTAHWLEERGVVVALFAGGAWIEAQPQGGCSGCAKQGCGTGLLARRRPSRLAVHTDVSLRVGDRVRLGMPTKSFLQAALIVYGLPLLAAILAGGFAETTLPSGYVTVPLAFVGGLLAGCLMSRYLLQRHQRQYQPILLAAEPL